MTSEWIDILETILVYKWPRMTRDEVRNMLGEIFNVELKQTRFYQDVFREGEQLVLRRILVKRFGSLPEWAEQRLIQADTAQLEKWSDRILDAPTLNEIFAKSGNR